jgi:integral membrane protein (TIGR01906 family)
MLKKITNVLLALLMMLVLISAAVIITLNFRQLYYWDMESLNISENTGLSDEIIKENYDVLIDYNSMFNYDELSFPTLPMSEHGKIHFEEVKNIFVGFEYFFVGALIVTAAGVIYKIRKKQYSFLSLTGIFAIVIPVILGGLIALNWNWFFVTFHEIAFSNDYWIFDPVTDPVINILPDQFFMHCAIMILALVIVGSIVCLILGTVLGRRKKKR